MEFKQQCKEHVKYLEKSRRDALCCLLLQSSNRFDDNARKL